MRTRRPAWKILLCGLGILLLLAGAFVAWVQAVAARRWAALQARVPVLVAEAKARDPRRPVLRGEAVEGDAWVDYDAALRAVAPLEALMLGDPARKVDVERASRALAGFGFALEHVARGARKTQGAFVLEFDRGLSAKLPDSLGAHTLVNLAILQARRDLEAGNAARARDGLLDAAQFAGDLGRNALVIGQVSSTFKLRALLDEMRALPPDTELARALAVLDGAWPDLGEAFLNEAVAATATLAQAAPAGLSAVGSWRYGFSTRILLADAAETHQQMMRRAADVTRWPWDDPRRKVRTPEDDPERHPNPVLQLFVPSGGAAPAGSCVARPVAPSAALPRRDGPA
jgi:hypothetical protein